MNPFDLIKKIINQGKSAISAPDNSTAGIIRNTFTGLPQATKQVASNAGSMLKTTAKQFVQPVTDFTKGSGIYAPETKAGIARNTITGLPGGVKEFTRPMTDFAKATGIYAPETKAGQSRTLIREIVLPTYGYTDKEIRESTPTVKEKALAIPKWTAGVYSGLSTLGAMGYGLFPGYNKLADEAVKSKTGNLLAGIMPKVQDFATPKTAGQAGAMRFLDVIGFLPVGSLKNVNTAAKLIANSTDVNVISKQLKSIGVPDEAIQAYAPILKEASDPKEVSRLINESYIPPRLQEEAVRLEIAKEELKNSPLNNPNNRFLFDKEGRVKNVADIKNNTTAKNFEKQMSEMVYGDEKWDSEDFVTAMEDFKARKKQIDLDQRAFDIEMKSIRQNVGKPVVKPVSQLDDLTQEAKRYKSADEFIEAQGEQVFRGGKNTFDKTLIGEDGVFVTPSKFMAGTFGKNVDELYISPSANVLFYNDLPKAIKDITNWDDYSKAVSKFGKENGVDVIDSLPPNVDYPRGMERTVLNPDVLKTKSQIENIWKQANTSRLDETASLQKMADEQPIRETTVIESPTGIKSKPLEKTVLDTAKKNPEVVIDKIQPDKRIEPFVTAKSPIIKAVANSTDEVVIRQEIKKLDVSDDIAATLSKQVKDIKDPIEISKIIRDKMSFVPLSTKARGVEYMPIRKIEFDMTPTRDIGGLAGGKSLNQRDLSLSVDNLDAFEIAKKGEFGPTTKAFYNFKQAETGKLEFIKQHTDNLAKVLKGLSKEDYKNLFEYRMGDKAKIVLSDKLKKVNQEITTVTDNMYDTVSNFAKDNKLSEVGKVEDYLPKRMQYQEGMSIDKRKEFSDAFMKSRVGGDLPGVQEKDISKLLARYIDEVANKVYMESALDQYSTISKLVKSKAPKASKAMTEFVESYRNPKVNDTFLENLAQTIIGARSTAALAGNIVWALTTNPSSLAFTFARNPRVLPILKGSLTSYGKNLKGIFNKNFDEWLNTLPTYRQKVDFPMSQTGLGDIGSPGIKPRIGGARQKFNAVVGAIPDFVEKELSRMSAYIAKEYGESLGMKGKTLDMYADLMIGLTQSEYMTSARPKALESVWTRLLAPFQTFAFESYRYGKTLVGAPGGGLPIKRKSQRLKQVVGILVFAEAFNWLQENISGRRINTPGSYVPLVGSVVDQGVSSVWNTLTGQKKQPGLGRTPIAPLEDYKNMTGAISSFVNNGNIQPLRKQLVRWTMGVLGIAGASQTNKIVDGIIANYRGYEVTSSGEPAFPIEGSDKYTSLIRGTYATKAGQEYIEGGFKTTQGMTLDKLKEETRTKLESGELGSVEVAKEYFEDGLKKIKDSEVNQRLSLPEPEYKKSLLSAIESNQLTVDEAKKEYEKYLNQESTTYEKRGKVKLVSDYARAFVKDPQNAFKALLPKEKLGNVEGNLVELQRFYGIYFSDKGGSDEYKKKLMQKEGLSWSKKGDYKLEHIVPVSAGGDNSDKNLVIVNNELHDFYTPVDIAVGRAVKEGTITRKKATELMTKLKVEKSITVEELLNMI